MFRTAVICLVCNAFLFPGFNNPQDADAQQADASSDSLFILAGQLQQGKADFDRYHASRQLSGLLTRMLDTDRLPLTGLDTLKNISFLEAGNREFLIISWVIPRQDGSFDYSGLVRFHDQPGGKMRIVSLTNQARELESPETKQLGPDHWYGALYYRLIENKFKGKVHYVLLGWDGNNKLSRKKLIEPVQISSRGKVIFGASVFSHYPAKVKRVIFEYAAHSSMSLNYSRQWMVVRLKKGKKRVTERKAADMIVFDRLVPLQEGLEGQYQFYVPETNIQDGFHFRDGRWVYIREVDARNPDSPDKEERERKVEFDLFPPVLPDKK
ncbi:MAG TPA: hypothetical protein P5531_04660 [Bacteroidales bacterium]|nr:hypothetical protein [Bacteroidales bacterium]HSA42705.1 hypothetical protein [Bacteroidales bacterium]